MINTELRKFQINITNIIQETISSGVPPLAIKSFLDLLSMQCNEVALQVEKNEEKAMQEQQEQKEQQQEEN